MLTETLLQLYVMAMTTKVTSPTPHLFGPPGCGKSLAAHQLAELVGHDLHIINVSRISPLELEGVQMPDKQNKALSLLTATFWTQLKDGDILLLDEFLRGFPEVYNGLLDILTSRRVGSFRLPNVFIMAASNTTVAYDKALEDRLLHITVPDPRHDAKEAARIQQVIVDELGLLPEMAKSMEMRDLVQTEVFPMYDMLDEVTAGARINGQGTSTKGRSIRNLVGQAKLRHVQTSALADVIHSNNLRAMNTAKFQYVLLLSGAHVDSRYPPAAQRLVGNPRLTEVQARNLDLNLQLIGMEVARTKKEEDEDDPQFV